MSKKTSKSNTKTGESIAEQLARFLHIKPKSSRETLLQMIAQHIKRNPLLSPEGFGWRAIKDADLVERLVTGGDVTTRKMDDIIRHMGSSKPFKRSTANEYKEKE